MKFIIILIIFIVIPSEISGISNVQVTKETYALVNKLATTNLAQEWGAKFAERFTKIAEISKKFAKFAGPAGEIIMFALTLFGEGGDAFAKEVFERFDKLNVKLDAISNQISLVDSKVDQSTKKILAEIKFQKFLTYLNRLEAVKHRFEGIISSFSSNSTYFVEELNVLINDYRSDNDDLKLVSILDSGIGITDTIIDDLIRLGRSYQKDNVFFGAVGTSTTKMITDVYTTALMAIVKANLIIQSAINLKSAMTGEKHEEDRRYNHYQKTDVLEKFYQSLNLSYNKLVDDDVDAYIDFSTNGNSNYVRMINVLQYFWQNEAYLSQGEDTCKRTCEDYIDLSYNGDGCNGRVHGCVFGLGPWGPNRDTISRPFWKQIPQNDRIYLGYHKKDDKYYGKSLNENYEMNYKDAFGRVFYDCDLCKCVCDQIHNAASVRKIYVGKISAPNGYVVTGVKFVEEDKVIFPKIQIGLLLPMALIDQSTVKWQDLPAVNNEDVKAFSFNARAIGFGDPSKMSFSDAVVTGVQFESTSYGVAWSIHGRKLTDYNTGILGEEEYIHSPDFPSKNMVSNGYDLIPGLASTQNYKIRKNIKVEFCYSNEKEDAGQSFVPYFDANEVTFEVKSPLSGITLIHYTNDDKYAGYVRPFIRSLDYKKYISTTYDKPAYIDDIAQVI